MSHAEPVAESRSRWRRLAAGLSKFEEGLAPSLRSLLGWLPLAILIGSVPGLVGWALAHGKLDYLLDNQLLTHRERIWALVAWSASVLVTGLGYLGYGLRRRKRAGASMVESMRRVNRALLPLLALPLILFFLLPKVETNHPFLVLSFCAGIAGIVGYWSYHLPLHLRGAAPLAFAGAQSNWRWVPWTVVALLTVAYAIGISWLAIVQHHGLATRIYDLGIYDNIFWQSIHGNPLGSTFVKSGNHIAAHVDPILILLSPLYLIYPQAELILVLQTVWLALGAIPLFLLARSVLGSPWYGVVFAAIYLLYPALHGANLYEFHSLTLAAPLLLAAMAALELGRMRTYALFVVLLLLTREDLSLVTCFVGLYAILAKERTRAGVHTIVGSVIYLAVIKLFVMPDPGLLMSNTENSYGYAYYYKDLIPYGGEGTFGLILSVLINPIFTIAHVFTEKKLLFLLQLFLPLLFLPFLVRRGKVVMVYGLAFLLLSSRGPVHSIYFQYPVVLFPLAMALAPIAIAELSKRSWPPWLEGRRLIPALSLGALAATMAVSFNYGAIFPSDAFRGGFQRLVRTLSPEQKERHAWVRSAVAQIPADASVSTTARLGPHVSNRREAVIFPARADYFFLDRSDLRRRGREEVKNLRQSSDYELVDSRKSITLWRWVGSDGGAAEAPSEIGLEADGGAGWEDEDSSEDEAAGAEDSPERRQPQRRGDRELQLRPLLELPRPALERIPLRPADGGGAAGGGPAE